MFVFVSNSEQLFATPILELAEWNSLTYALYKYCTQSDDCYKTSTNRIVYVTEENSRANKCFICINKKDQIPVLKCFSFHFVTRYESHNSTSHHDIFCDQSFPKKSIFYTLNKQRAESAINPMYIPMYVCSYVRTTYSHTKNANSGWIVDDVACSRNDTAEHGKWSTLDAKLFAQRFHAPRELAREDRL